jgi:hypothetical protein
VQPPILILHICGGTLGMLSGFAAAFLRKGSRRHDIAGNVFVASMPILSVTGTYMAFLKSQPGNVLGGASPGAGMETRACSIGALFCWSRRLEQS